MSEMIQRMTLESDQAEVALLSLGAATQSWRVADGRNVILSHRSVEAYRQNPNFLGAIAGRVCNRTAQGRFRLDGQDVQLPCNDGDNHLHGGPEGLWTKTWDMARDSKANAIRLSYHSADGEGGYPGNAWVEMTVTLTGARLRYDMQVTVDRPTPVALAQHNYYHLGGPCFDTVLQIDATHYLPTDDSLIPTGQEAPVHGTEYDFTNPAPIGKRMQDAHLILGSAPVAAQASGNGLTLRMWTDQPGLQFYSGANLSGAHAKWGGFCLEPQLPPNSANTDLDLILATPDRPYRQVTDVEIL